MSVVIRTVGFTVTPTGVTPDTPQFAGVAGDDKVTRVTLQLDASLQVPNARYRLRCIDGLGQAHTSDFLTLSQQGTLTFDLPACWTAAGGEAQVSAAVECLNAGGDVTAAIYSAPAGLYFVGRDGEAPVRREVGSLLADCHDALNGILQAQVQTQQSFAAMSTTCQQQVQTAQTAAMTAHSAMASASTSAVRAEQHKTEASSSASAAATSATAAAGSAAAAAASAEDAADAADAALAVLESSDAEMTLIDEVTVTSSALNWSKVVNGVAQKYAKLYVFFEAPAGSTLVANANYGQVLRGGTIQATYGLFRYRRQWTYFYYQNGCFFDEECPFNSYNDAGNFIKRMPQVGVAAVNRYIEGFSANGLNTGVTVKVYGVPYRAPTASA
ncbi:MAG: hypothetical protein IKI50_05215 [Clostridia bacterium]|nr:hypothetical protein [Clostridia bacterium]